MRLSKGSCLAPFKSENSSLSYSLSHGFLSDRKLLFLSVSLLLLSAPASAITLGPLNCTPFPATFAGGNGGPTPVSCPAFTVAGATLNSVTLNYFADYQFGTGAVNTVQVTFTPAGPAGVTWTPPSSMVNVTGGASSGAIGTGSSSATAGVSAANFAAAFNVNITSAVTAGVVATSSGAVTVTYDYTAAPPPPPPAGPVCSPATTPTFTAGVPNAFMVRYASNLVAGDSVVNITNTGASSTVAFPTQNGNINVNVYVFSPDEQLISCCCCPVTPNGLVSLSARNDLINNPLTPAVPTSTVIKLLATDPTGTTLVDGLAAWGTTIHALPVTPGSPATTYGTAETRFTPATLSAAELTRLSQLCMFITTQTGGAGNGSGFGICRACRLGGLGAAKE